MRVHRSLPYYITVYDNKGITKDCREDGLLLVHVKI